MLYIKKWFVQGINLKVNRQSSGGQGTAVLEGNGVMMQEGCQEINNLKVVWK